MNQYIFVSKIGSLSILLIPIIMSVVGCQDRQEDFLEKICEISEHAPDSALLLLESPNIDTRSMSHDQLMRRAILLADCRERYGLNLPDDSIIAEAYSYFEHKGRKRERILSRFIAGCACRDRGDIDAAEYHYREALRLTGTMDKRYELMMSMRIRLALVGLSIQENEIQESIKEAHNIISTARKNKAGRYLHEGMMCLAEAYMAGGNALPARKVSKMLYDSLQRGGLDCHTIRNICPRLSELFILLGDYDKVGRILSFISLYEKSYVTLSSASVHDRADMRYLYARYYEGIGETDSASQHYMAMLDTRDTGRKIVAYRNLASLAAAEGDNNGYMRWSAELIRAEDSVSCHVGNRSGYSACHDTLSLSGILREKESDRETMTLCLVLVLLLLIVNVIAWRVTMRKKKKRIMTLQNQMYHDTLDRLHQARHDYETLRCDTNKLAEDKEKEINRLQMLLSTFMENTAAIDDNNIVRDFYTSDYIVSLHNLAARGKSMSPNDVIHLKELVAAEIPSFADMYKAKGELLSPNEDAICLLTRMRFLPTEIAVLLDMTPQRVTNLRASINKKLFNARGARTFDKNIMSIV